jgi:hypothetical protein
MLSAVLVLPPGAGAIEKVTVCVASVLPALSTDQYEMTWVPEPEMSKEVVIVEAVETGGAPAIV